jgi:cell division protein FtsW
LPRGNAAGGALHAETRVPYLASGWEAPALLLLAVVFLSIGLVTVYSASSVKAQTEELADYFYVVQQAVGGVIGLVLLVLMARIDYRALRLVAWPLLLGLIVTLIVIVVPGTEAIAPARNGARRWLVLGPIALQPSEFAKLVLVIWTAALAVKKQDKLLSLSRGLMPFLVVWLVVVGLIFLEPSLSAALLTLLLSATVLFAGGARIGHFLLLAAVGLPLLWTQVDSVAYRMRRILAFLDPHADPTDLSYQITQALIAIGSGGPVGRGFGSGQQKFGFLPEPHNDFLFAMFGEEWGVAGALVLVVLFSSFALVGYRIARAAPDLFGSLLAIGCTNLIAVQAFLHMMVNVALIPTTGVTLPFMSYGRSSLMVCLMAVGILANIARHAERRAE